MPPQMKPLLLLASIMVMNFMAVLSDNEIKAWSNNFNILHLIPSPLLFFQVNPQKKPNCSTWNENTFFFALLLT